MELHKRCFFVLSGLSNTLGKGLAVEMCQRFKSGSVILLLESSNQEDIWEIQKEIKTLDNDVHVICDWKQQVNFERYQEILSSVLDLHQSERFELAFVLHNECNGATNNILMESQSVDDYVQQLVYAPVTLNQAFLQLPQLIDAPKLVVNISSTLKRKPLFYNLCKKSRDMYFRAMADAERPFDVSVLTYSPGILATQSVGIDVYEKQLLPTYVQPIQAILKLINILQQMSFISGHDVDYYDTYSL